MGGWDGGDCCGGTNSYEYCDIKTDGCKCLDPTYVDQCGNEEYKGDHVCDDDNNSPACDFDGGDCCGKIKRTYCKICQCLDPNYEPCAKPDWQGDGTCDDMNNLKHCSWDRGDCCGKDVDRDYCDKCECLDPLKQQPSTTTKNPACGASDYVGDNVCDDNNNNAGCNYDGGDCCVETVEGGVVIEEHCDKCYCKDPRYGCAHQNGRAMGTATTQTTQPYAVTTEVIVA